MFIKTVNRILSVLAIVCYVVIGLYAFISAPAIAGYKPVVVLSGSMEPEYMTGSVAYYKSASFEDVKVYDVIAFRFGENDTAAHRVVSIDTDARQFTTKGDNVIQNDDSPVNAADLRGVVSQKYILPYAGYYVRFIEKNFYLLVLIAAILVAKIVFGYLDSDTGKAPDENKTAVKKENEIAHEKN